MFHSLIALLPAIVGAERGSRRRGRSGRRAPKAEQQEDLGKWIWIASSEPRNYYLYARKTFELKTQPTNAIVKASADSKYKLFVNGQYVGKGPVRSPRGVMYYDWFDVTALMSRGINVIAFLVHHIGEPTYSYIPRKGGLLCRVDIDVAGETLSIGSDETWKVHRADDWRSDGQRLSRRLGFQEIYDARAKIEHWNEGRFREKGWENAIVLGMPPDQPWGLVKPREIPPLCETKVLPQTIYGVFNAPERAPDMPVSQVPEQMSGETLATLTAGRVKNIDALLSEHDVAHITTPRGNKGVAIILDFGKEVFGNVEIGIAGSGGGVIDLGYGELLQEGQVRPSRSGVNYTDRIILRKGRLDWQGFEPRAFRYLQMEFRSLSRALALEYVRVNQTTYMSEPIGHFECSDQLLNRIWQTAVYTAQLCMEDTYIDCPWRERAQWWGDARIESRAVYYVFGDTKLLRQGLRQLAASQNPDGSISGMYPSGENKLLPDFALLWVFSLLDYYAFADDEATIRELYPNLRKLMRWFERFVDDNGLLIDVPGWLFIDWADLEKHGNVTALNCLYYQALRVASALAQILNKEDDAKAYAARAARVRSAINKYLYSPRRALYAECRVDGKLVERFSRQANILAALFDIPDQYAKAALFRQITNGALREITTPYFTSYLLEALYADDRHTDALEIIRKKWGGMLDAGATTFWEHFEQHESLCHGWAAGPARDLMAEYLGVKPVPGAHRFSITPHPADLKWARGRMETKLGPLEVEWRAVRDTFVIELRAPRGLKIDIYPPAHADTRLFLDGRSHAARIITVEGGHHIIKALKWREPVSRKNEELVPLTAQVELVGEDIVSHGVSMRRRTKTGVQQEPVEGLEWEVEPTPVEESESATVEKKSSRSRRGGRGKARQNPKSENTPQDETPNVATALMPEPKPDPATEVAFEEPKARAPRKRRRPGRSKQPESQETTEDASASADEPTPLSDHATSSPEPEHQPEHRGGRRPRTRRKPPQTHPDS
jgi:alpha-L-rhamnosidase